MKIQKEENLYLWAIMINIKDRTGFLLKEINRNKWKVKR